MNDTILLIDGSSLCYIHGNKENYSQTLREHIEMLLRKFNTNKYLIVLEDSSSNFRNEVAISNQYKGHRRDDKFINRIDKYLPYLKNVFKEIRKYKPVLYKGVENDDVISILTKRYRNTVMVANDVDYMSVPGYYYNVKTNKSYHIGDPGYIKLDRKGKVEATGYYQVFYQVMKGSQKENYKGLPKYGPKKVYNILKNCDTEEDMVNECIRLFKQSFKHKWKEKLQEGFRLCWIIRNNESLITPKPVIYNVEIQ